MIRFSKVDFEKVFSALPQLDSLFNSYRFQIVAVYIFGSLAKNQLTPLSDVDIAVLVSNNISKECLSEFESAIYKDLSKLFCTDEIDITILNNLSQYKQYSVIKNKKLIYCTDYDALLDFENDAVLNYLDFSPIRKEFDAAYIDNLNSGDPYA